jgi:hypothetical protein
MKVFAVAGASEDMLLHRQVYSVILAGIVIRRPALLELA